MENQGTNWYLYITAVTVNLATLTAGSMLAWTSPSLEILKKNSANNPLDKPLTTSEAALISSLLPIGSICSCIISAPLSDRFGRKRTLLLASSAIYISYLLIAFANKVWHIYAARFAGGLVFGAAYTIIPNYTAEVSQKHNRGLLGSYFAANISLGKLLIYLIGPFLTIQETSFIFLVPVTVFITIFSFIPESPYWLSSKYRESEAEASLATFRRKAVKEVDEEMSEIRCFVKKSFEVQGGFFDIYRNKSLFRMLRLIVGLMFFQQFSGVNVVIFYMQSIFDSSGSTLSPAIATIIIGVVQFITNFLPPLLVDRAGRRIMLLISITLEGVSMVAIGTFFVLREYNISTNEIFWLPILSLVVYNIGYNLGMGPVTFIMLGELFPPHVKAVASAMGIATLCASMAISTSIFPYLVEALGQGETFWCFGACCFIGIFFIYFFVPETKGKSLSEINQTVIKS